MRNLTLTGFLSAYVKELSQTHTLNIRRLYSEIKNGNYRLKEPFFLYCLYSGKSGILNSVLTSDDKEEYSKSAEFISSGDLEALPVNYLKVFEAYKFRSNRHNNEIRIKALMVNKIIKLQNQKNVTNYRIYTDLHLNAGNYNDFIKNKNYNKLSLNKSREVIKYLENI